MDVDNNHEAIRGWTKEEKFNLIQALKSGGINNMRLIQQKVPTRTPEELKAGLDYFKSIALQHPLLAVKEEKKPKKKSSSSSKKKSSGPITQWQQQLTNSLNPDQLRTETATAFRMIADGEDFPPPEVTENIDMRQVYHQIANAMDGKPIVADAGTAAVLHKCLVETALRSKVHLNPKMKDFLQKVAMPDKDGVAFTSATPTEDAELATIRHLTAQRAYNPLNVPEELLKSPFSPTQDKNT